jgi:hypothetical protein
VLSHAGRECSHHRHFTRIKKATDCNKCQSKHIHLGRHAPFLPVGHSAYITCSRSSDSRGWFLSSGRQCSELKHSGLISFNYVSSSPSLFILRAWHCEVNSTVVACIWMLSFCWLISTTSVIRKQSTIRRTSQIHNACSYCGLWRSRNFGRTVKSKRQHMPRQALSCTSHVPPSRDPGDGHMIKS